MSLLRLRNIQLSYGAAPLFDGIDVSIEKGERLCLIGRNGAGKSTFMKLIAGEIQADDGERVLSQGMRIARLIQEVPQSTQGSVRTVVAEGLGELGQWLSDYATVIEQMSDASHDADALSEQLASLQEKIDTHDGWEVEQRINAVLSRLELDGNSDFHSLSGGMKRRVLLAQALVQNPDLLLLDEPTNHLDIDSIRWLEEFLLQYPATLLFITHDRAFLRRLSTRILEIDRGKITSWPGNYEQYLTGKQALLDAEEKANAEFDKKLAQEEVWIRQGIKARRTRNEGRVRALKALREERKQRRERLGTSKLEIHNTEQSGKIVMEVDKLSYHYESQPIVDDFSTTILRGDRVGIIGANGCGKSTLLKLLLGKLAPQTGSVKHGTKLEIAYFDQLRDSLDEEKTVAENIGEGRDTLTIRGEDRHVLSYLQDFLFPPNRARQPVKALSGGERNRLLLAKLFTRPFNFLVLDEPTNDLDAETLDLLEEQLIQFDGTLLLVSHDREFIDHVVTSTWVFEQTGLREYVGGYSDWLRQSSNPVLKQPNAIKAHADSLKQASKETGSATQTATTNASATPAKKAKKLSYKEQRELDALPERIEQLESSIATIHQQQTQPDFFKQAPEAITQAQTELATLETELAHAYERWEALDQS